MLVCVGVAQYYDSLPMKWTRIKTNPEREREREFVHRQSPGFMPMVMRGRAIPGAIQSSVPRPRRCFIENPNSRFALKMYWKKIGNRFHQLGDHYKCLSCFSFCKIIIVKQWWFCSWKPRAPIAPHRPARHLYLRKKRSVHHSTWIDGRVRSGSGCLVVWT